MTSTPLLLGAAAALATAAGGAMALRYRHRLMLIVALAAGVVLGVAVFDLLPEAIELGTPIIGARPLGLASAGGLAGYWLLARAAARRRDSVWRAHLAPATLTLHSLVDGLGIGLAFQAGDRIGWVVAAAVLSHDLVDGVNVVGLSLASRTEVAARRWLVANSAAPLIGAVLGGHAPVSPGALALLLATLAGAFLYISVGELLPRSLRLDPRPRTAMAGAAGLMLTAAVAGLVR